MRKITALLREWGDFVIAHMDHADEIGENVLHRYSEYGYTDPQPEKSKVLCADMPIHLKRMDIAVNRLPHLQRATITLTYCAPIKGDGNEYTKSELARKLRINKGKFRAELRKGINNLEKVQWRRIELDK